MLVSVPQRWHAVLTSVPMRWLGAVSVLELLGFASVPSLLGAATGATAMAGSGLGVASVPRPQHNCFIALNNLEHKNTMNLIYPPVGIDM